MSLNVSASGGNEYPLVPEGIYAARCFKIIDLGTQKVEWQGTEKHQRKVFFSWELLDDEVKMEDGKPWAVSKKYTATLDERGRLRPDLEAWRGKKFTDSELANFLLTDTLGAYCTIQVVHSEDGKYANVNSIMAFKGVKPKAVNPDVSFDVDVPDMKIFETFSDRMKEQIKESAEWQTREAAEKVFKPAQKAAPVLADDIDDVSDEPIDLSDIPFSEDLSKSQNHSNDYGYGYEGETFADYYNNKD